MGILIKSVRVSGFRGLDNIEVALSGTTVLTGMNNSGKTSFLKALQLAFGSSQFLSSEDFAIQKSKKVDRIIIDSCIVPVDNNGIVQENFDSAWENLLTEKRIKLGESGAFVPLRTVVANDTKFEPIKPKHYILKVWPDWYSVETKKHWHEAPNGDETNFRFEELPFFYMDAQRDILEDIHLKNSYLGKMISNIEYSPEDIKTIEQQIKILNDITVETSGVLSQIRNTLKELDTAMDNTSEGIEITPFTKKVRDLNKGLSIYYADGKEPFSMEYHGMGTRSWSSLLTLKAFIALSISSAAKKHKLSFPILAIEEPESHLHPNAQKRLYSQIQNIAGQKIISTHSAYIAGTAKLSQIRNFYKDASGVKCGQIELKELKSEDIRKIERMVLNTRGEVLFSKGIVLFEGETEEQALPIFAESHFNKTPLELGINFIGVGGSGNYLPFLRLCESLNIPWVILSDGETQAAKDVKSALKQLSSALKNSQDYTDQVVFLPNQSNFERYLLDEGFVDEVKTAFAQLHTAQYLSECIEKKRQRKPKREETKDVCEKCHQNIFKEKERASSELEDIYYCMVDHKAQLGPQVAEEIVKSGKQLPAQIVKLFSIIYKKCLQRSCQND